MGNGIVARYAFFPPTPPTYDESLEGLEFVSLPTRSGNIPVVFHKAPKPPLEG